YASAAREGAPQATQVADRFHLYKNLTEALELSLARCRADIRRNALSCPAPKEVLRPVIEKLESVSLSNWKPAPSPGQERVRLARRAQRYDRYQQVMELHQAGFEQPQIAARVGLSRRTVQRWLACDGFPEHKGWKRRSVFDPFAP